MEGYFIWANPEALRWLWAAPALAALVWFAQGCRDAGLRAFLAEQYAAGQWRHHRRRRLLKGSLLVCAFCLVVTAAARPRVGVEMQRVERRGADVVLVMDTSDSMLAQDVAPSRLAAAREAAQALIARLAGDRIGLVVFAGSAYVYSPLTQDHDAAGMFVSSVERGSAPAPGTFIEDALTTAQDLLDESGDRHRVIVLFSDGEEHGDFRPEKVTALRDAGVQVHTVGVGSPEGAPIPLPEEALPEGQEDPAGWLPSFLSPADARPRSRFKQDAEGNPVLTRANPRLMAETARAGGGVHVQASPTGVNVERIHGAVAGLDSAVEGTYEFTRHAERFQWPLGAAVLLLALEALISAGPRRREADAE